MYLRSSSEASDRSVSGGRAASMSPELRALAAEQRTDGLGRQAVSSRDTASKSSGEKSQGSLGLAALGNASSWSWGCQSRTALRRAFDA
jgi:hypothetical protein